jgi:hypothetical protein
MIKKDTYLVINKQLTPKLKNIKQFKLNLGTKLIGNNDRFMPNDVNIQKHYMFFQNVILLIGTIGTLKVYTKYELKFNEIQICNEDKSFNYTLDENLSVYDNINESLDIFFNKYNLEKNITTTVEKETLKQYTAPDKPFKEMTVQERILYARNNK